MVGFHRASREPVNVFEVDGQFLFRHYFSGEEVFDRLKRYYDGNQYRFEVPASDLGPVREFLADHGYDLVDVETTAEFVVVVRQYTAHPENIFKDSVIQRSREGHNFFLMTDRDAVDRAVAAGARRLSETGFDDPFEPAADEGTGDDRATEDAV